MAEQKPSDAMDDVDRLFQCFKCGVTPPESALRERKRSKSKLKQGSVLLDAASSTCGTPSPGSAEPRKKIAISVDNVRRSCCSTSNANKLRCGKQISPVVFYGSPNGVPPKRPISLLRLLREIRVDLSEQGKENLRKEVWATFPRQNEAMNFAKEHNNVRIFSYQDHLLGQRRFLVSTYHEFWKRYRNMDSKFRHHYEVIQEGLPCHLYFDLEFSTKDNVGKNGDEMIDLLISVVFDALNDNYSIEGSEDWVVELDSSTTEKFSRHLIIRIPKAAFKDNSHVGSFVSEEEEDMFMASLICNVDSDTDRLLVCKMDMECVKKLHFDTEVNYSVTTKYREPSNNGTSSRGPPITSSTEGKSPFPALDRFVECIASTGNTSGKIRSWYWFSEDGLMVYSMLRNRYCERIGREHKSNHVPIPQHAVHHQSILREPIPAPNFPYTVKKKSLAKTGWKPENIQKT
ncbi:DNA-directed primase/polymerase protein [Linum perenne]